MVYRGTITNGVARIIHCPLPQISTYYYITPVRHPYEAIKWSFNLLMGHYLLVEPRIGLSLKDCAYE